VRDRTIESWASFLSALQGVALHFEPSGSFLKFELMTNGMVK